MEIDLIQFSSLLVEAQDDEYLSKDGLSSYLMESLFYPYIEGKDIPLYRLDYDAFGLEDLDRLFEYIGDLSTVYSDLERKMDNIWKSKPAACRSRAFC